MTSPLNAAEHHGNGEHIRHEQRDQYQRAYRDVDQPIHEPYHAFVRAWSPRASRVETASANAGFSFSRAWTRTSPRSERPVLSSVCAGRFVSRGA